MITAVTTGTRRMSYKNSNYMKIVSTYRRDKTRARRGSEKERKRGFPANMRHLRQIRTLLKNKRFWTAEK